LAGGHSVFEGTILKFTSRDWR